MANTSKKGSRISDAGSTSPRLSISNPVLPRRLPRVFEQASLLTAAWSSDPESGEPLMVVQFTREDGRSQRMYLNGAAVAHLYTRMGEIIPKMSESKQRWRAANEDATPNPSTSPSLGLLTAQQ